MKAKDIMAESPVSVSSDARVRHVAELLVQHGISSLPVVSEEGAVLGIVTEADLFLKERRVPFSQARALTLFGEWAAPDAVERTHRDVDRLTAADVMSRAVHCVDAEEDLRSVAGMMVRHGLKRVPVVSRGRLVGMLSRRDLIGRIAGVRRPWVRTA